MSQRVKLLPQSDVNEVVQFQQYLLDLRSEMAAPEFAHKWHEYMGVDEALAERHVRIERGEYVGQ